jgi:uroporphyrin-III C-methyltransferase/precorrin-2 dehydrogenase/sirohydrochlorin ferrochelatase
VRYFPLFVDLAGRTGVVVGGTPAAAAKARLLSEAGARTHLVCLEAATEVLALARTGGVSWERRAFTPGDLQDAAVVIAATGNGALDAAVSEAARARNIPVNVVDNPDLSTFAMPAIVDRDPVTIAISTAGAAPVLARRLRQCIEALVPAEIGRLARFAESFRPAVRAVIADGDGRRRFWERLLAGPIAAAVLAGDERWARERMLAAVNRRELSETGGGIVHLVGAGPGDPELLTLKALRLLQEADVIIYDRLVAPGILAYARREARRIDAGKANGDGGRGQERINRILLAEARAGRRVVRLKGGDPLVFGRGGEEKQFLLRHGVRVEVVAGVTAAIGCAAAAGLPLTHRDHASALTFVTGHGKDGEPAVDWAALARAGHTIAVYMGGTAAGRIARRLIDGGLDPATAVAVIENGTRPGQRVSTGTLTELPGLAAASGGSGPVLLVIGEVVRQADAWGAERRLQAAAG